MYTQPQHNLEQVVAVVTAKFKLRIKMCFMSSLWRLTPKITVKFPIIPEISLYQKKKQRDSHDIPAIPIYSEGEDVTFNHHNLIKSYNKWYLITSLSLSE